MKPWTWFAWTLALFLQGWLPLANHHCHAGPMDREHPGKSKNSPQAHTAPNHEHATALALFQAGTATHLARQSGDWADPATWNNGVPGPMARVFIPAGVKVSLHTELPSPLDWLRLEGTLCFAANASSKLQVATILVPETGCLLVGSENDPVHPDRTASILFTPRPEEHRRHDPADLTGGLIALGKVQIYGTPYRGFACPTQPIVKNTTQLKFAEPPRGWKVGDELLFPASTAASKDERRTITALTADGLTVTLSAPLESDHSSFTGITTTVPVGNLTRNVVLASTDPDTLAHRAHLMFMTHQGIHLSGVRFRGLGRTLTTRAHTLPQKDASGKVDTGNNLIGRYAVHYHLRGGALLTEKPQMFVGNVILDSPKHGLVNHGGYVVAENNVTYAIHGSHFFAENGSEIGAFRNNLAVYSRGSQDKIRSREALFDFGHGGHGFWTQSPAVVMEGNHAYHHADAAYSIFPRPVVELGKYVMFDRRNLSPEIRATARSEYVAPGMVPFHFEGNTAGNSGKGLEVWNVNTYSNHNVPSVIVDCQFWDTPHGGIDLPYTFNTEILRTRIVGQEQGTGETRDSSWTQKLLRRLSKSTPDADRQVKRHPGVGIAINSSTRFLKLDEVQVSGYTVGIEAPVRGHTRIANSQFANFINIRLGSPVQAGRRTELANNTFTRQTAHDIDYYLADPDCKFNGDLSLVFERDLLLVEDARFPGKTLYFAEQHPQAAPEIVGVVKELKDKSARQMQEEFGLAIAGSLAPDDASARPGVRGLVGAVNEEIKKGLQETARHTFVDDMENYKTDDPEYTRDQNLDRVRFVKGKPGEASGWRLTTTREKGKPRSRLVYVDSTAPHFELTPCMKLEIHPDDVKHGIEICGILHDEIAGQKTIKNMIKEFRDLKIDEDGFVTVNYICADSVGNEANHTYRFKVSDQAVRRGPNIGYYKQEEFVPSEPMATPVVPRRASSRIRNLYLIGGGCLAALSGMLAWTWRKRKKQRKSRPDIVALTPERKAA